MLDAGILPFLGGMALEEIKPMTLLVVLRRFEDRGAMERANKARRRSGEVFRYAVVTGRAKYNPAPDLADAMKGYRKKNFPFLPADQIPAFNQALAGYGGSVVSRIATQVLQYTAMRTKDLRSMLWQHVDFENWLILIDAEVMKNRKQHLVPMSQQVYDLLKHIQPITSLSPFVFAGRNDTRKPISETLFYRLSAKLGTRDWQAVTASSTSSVPFLTNMGGLRMPLNASSLTLVTIIFAASITVPSTLISVGK